MPEEIPKIGYLFDIDGVLRAGTEKVKAAFIRFFLSEASNGIPVGFVTGNSASFVEKLLVEPMNRYAGQYPGAFKNIAFACEHGNVLIHFKDGKWTVIKGKRVVPAKVIKEAYERISEIKGVKADLQRTTFPAALIEKGLEIKDPELAKKALEEVEAAFKAVARKHRKLGLRVLGFPPIAVDMIPKQISKAYGAARVMRMLPKPKQYFAFGDSRTDIEMVRPLAKQKKDYYFVFVGSIERLRERAKTKGIDLRRIISVGKVVEIREGPKGKEYVIKPDRGPLAIKTVLKVLGKPRKKTAGKKKPPRRPK